MKKKTDENQISEAEEIDKESYGDLKVKDNKVMNTVAKILAFVCAVIIWFFAVGNESPHFEKTYTNLTVEITGIPQGMSVMSGGGTLVDITVMGIRSEVNDLDKDDIKVYADASAITTPGKYDLPISAELGNGITVQSFSRDAVSVYISTASQKIIPLSAKLIDYTMPPDCTVKTTIKGEPTVTVFGPKEELDKITRASVVVSPGNIVSALTCSGQIKLYDESGEEYTNTFVTQSLHEAIVEVELMTVADITLTVDSLHGYFTEDNTEITVSPSTITVSGRYEDISGISSINIYTVDETKITSDSKLQLQLDLPDGMTSTEQITDISVSIKHTGTSVKTFPISQEMITMNDCSDAYIYEPYTAGLTVRVRGENNASFAAMTAENISVSVDVGSCEPGTSVLPAKVTIKGVSGLAYVLGEYTIEITVTNAPAETSVNG